ncbi:MAG TPA: hypothetical protein VLJ21_04250 [Candidatus Binatia bacterium]|nr:hypothetical protein [Candidatus Binatia bacterium]
MKHVKHRLSSSEEFEVMRLVFDKFLWLGTFFVGWGLFSVLTSDFSSGMYRILIGVLIFVVFAGIVVREFEMIR